MTNYIAQVDLLIIMKSLMGSSSSENSTFENINSWVQVLHLSKPRIAKNNKYSSTPMESYQPTLSSSSLSSSYSPYQPCLRAISQSGHMLELWRTTSPSQFYNRIIYPSMIWETMLTSPLSSSTCSMILRIILADWLGSWATIQRLALSNLIW